MKKFLLKSLLFLSFSTLLIVSLLLISNKIINQTSNLDLSEKKPVIILGHSHPERAYNDSIITKVKNVSSAAESFFYTFIKSKIIVEHNNHIKVALIECSNNQFSIEMDGWTWGSKMSNRLHKYGPFMDLESNTFLFSKSPMLFIESTSVLFKKNISRIFTSEYLQLSELGGYSWNNKILKNEPEFLPGTKGKFLISSMNISYLKKIISFLESRNIKVFLIRTPTLKEYYNKYSESQFEKLLKINFPNIEFLDFSKFEMNYSNYGDCQHMNQNGAIEYSSWIEYMLKKGLLNKANKQKFIDFEIEKRMRSSE